MRYVISLSALLCVACAPPPPGEFVCVNSGAASGTCQDVCAARGSSCIPNPPDDHACGLDPRFNNPSASVFISVADCTRVDGSRASYSDSCDEPLFVPHGPAGSTYIPLSVACCCAL